MILRILFITLSILLSTLLAGQASTSTEEKGLKKKSTLRFQFDSRRTFVDKKSVGLIGVRLGKLFNEKTEVGFGIYSSNLFGILGSTADKSYQDKNFNPHR